MISSGANIKIPTQWPEQVHHLAHEALVSGKIGAIRKALSSIDALDDELRGSEFRLGIAGTFTLDTCVDPIRLALSTCPCIPVIKLGALDNVEQTLLNPDSDLMRFSPHAILVLWRIEELHPELAMEGNCLTPKAREEITLQIISRIRSLCQEFVKISTTPLFISTLPSSTSLALPLQDIHTLNGTSGSIIKINREIINVTAEVSQIHVFDFAGWASSYGDSAFDIKFDLYGRQPIAQKAVISFASFIKRFLRPLIFPPAKALALDLDNTLWGGILGEDGIEGLKIGHEYPGNIYMRIQRFALVLKSLGILLVLLSKNNLEDVKQAFEQIPDMPISLDDFAAIRINWNPKPDNLREVAKELNIGLDSFVFVDDQDFERKEMAFILPEVTTLEVSDDPLHIWKTLKECDNFDFYRSSKEDLERAGDYKNIAKRKKLQQEAATVEDFLYTLNLEAVIEPFNKKTAPRVVQMLAKTNQFNVTTRRHTESDVRQMMLSENNVLLTISLRDRFGSQGIIGIAIALSDKIDRDVTLDTLLLSCRALGRGAENALWAYLVNYLSSRGYEKLKAEYVATKKNGQVKDLFDRIGMNCVSESEERKLYEMQLPCHPDYPGWIKILEESSING